jgi:hypothetical protein
MNYAVINSETNIVENVTLWDGVVLWTPPEGRYVQLLDNALAGIGWSFVDNQFVPPVIESNG